MYEAYALAYMSARLVRDRAFEMNLLTWKQVHEAKDEDQTQETRKAGKQRTEAAQHARMETGQKEGRAWEAGKQDGREASKQETGKPCNREAGKGKQGSREARKQGNGAEAREALGSRERGWQGSIETENRKARQ